jgi:hypothetical protein
MAGSSQQVVEYLGLNGFILFPNGGFSKQIDLNWQTYLCGCKIADQKWHSLEVYVLPAFQVGFNIDAEDLCVGDLRTVQERVIMVGMLGGIPE